MRPTIKLRVARPTDNLEAVALMRNAGYRPVPPFNPFWAESGATFEDPDGDRVVLQHAAWER